MTVKIFGVSIKISKEHMVIAFLVLALVFLYIGFILWKSGEDIIVQTNAGKGDIELSVGDNKKEEKTEDFIKVHIKGCVNNPGVITLKRGQILKEAIEAAGGISAQADIDNINLVYKLNYNQAVRILSREETRANGETGPASGADIITDSGAAVEEESVQDGKININSATIEVLKTLPEVGPSKAEKIVVYREQNGAYKSIEDIMNVSGIKEATFSKIKDLIKVE